MADPDPYKAWLDDFKREIDALAAQPLEPSHEAGRQAQAAFADWWKSELGPSAPPAAPAAPDQAAPPAGGTAGRLEALAQDKSALKSELALARQENAGLRQRLEESKAAKAELEAKLVRMQEAQDSGVANLQEKVRSLEEQLQERRQDKTFAEKTCERLESRASSLDDELRQTAAREASAQREALEARRRLAELEPELQRLKQDHAAAQAVIAELRRQASSYQERVVDYQEHTGSEVTMLRQELREFLIKVKRLIDEAAGRQP
jgi:chromosome segregation ATPase